MMTKEEIDVYKQEITDMMTEVRQTAEELVSTARKEVIEILEGRITDTETKITQNADQISAVAEKVVAHGNDIAEFNSFRTQTAEQIEDIVKYRGIIDGKFTEMDTSITQTAELIQQVATRINEEVDGKLSTLESSITQTAEDISIIAGRVDGYENSISELRSELIVESESIASRVVKQNLDEITGRVESMESEILQKAESISLRVTNESIRAIQVGARNFIRQSDYTAENNDLSKWHNAYPDEYDMYMEIIEDSEFDNAMRIKVSTKAGISPINNAKFHPELTSYFRQEKDLNFFVWVRSSTPGSIMIYLGDDVGNTMIVPISETKVTEQW